MLISKNPKFLFIHIQKTGGTSLIRALQSGIDEVARFRGTHDHAAWAREDLGADFDSYFKFAFVRNPWERLVSWYTMIEQRSRVNGGEGINRFWTYVLSKSKSFDDFVIHCTDTVDDTDGRKSVNYSQLDYISDDRGRLIVDFVGRYERIEEDARTIFDRLGVNGVPLPHENRSSHRDYRHYYTDVTRRIVAQRYARDIEYFGYAF
jgi:hypothetical protein